MSRVTLGKLVLETARGQRDQQPISKQEVQDLSRNISELVVPKVDEIRSKQRRALEELKPVVLL